MTQLAALLSLSPLWFLLLTLSGDPVHFAMGTEYEQVVRAEEVFTFPGKDSMLTHTVELLYDEADQPLLFFSDILTPVCIDNICKPMAIQIYWNLVGAYVGYGIYPEEPLTKYDHDLFEEADYAKLHDLLLNPHSILERRKLSDLFDPEARAPEAEQVTFKGQEVDAVSGATRKEIKESVVEGALYSCYTIWHLVHGEVVAHMNDHLEKIYTPEIATYFLHSDYADYQQYALKRLDEAGWMHNLSRILEIFEQASPLIRRYILRKLPDPSWSAPAITEGLYDKFGSWDTNSKTLLIQQLEEAPPEAAIRMAPDLTALTKNQLRAYLAFLEAHPTLAESPTIAQELQHAAGNANFPHAYLISAFLEAKK